MSTLALDPPTSIARTPDGEFILAQGSNGRGRGRLIAIGVASGVAAMVIGLLAGSTEVGAVATGLLVISAAICLPLAVWRQHRSFLATRDGITLRVGSAMFGETYLVPWRDVQWLGVTPYRGGRGRVAIKQCGMGRRTILPMAAVALAEAESIVETLRPLAGC